MTGAVLAWRFLGTVTAVAALAALRWLTTAPLGSTGNGVQPSQLRLSFSARPERIERCRELSDEELAKLPAHMRLRTQCEGYSARYLLRVSIGDRRLDIDTLRGGGLRHDRPLHVFRDFDVRPGEQRLRIDITRMDEGVEPRDRDREEDERERHDEAPDTLLGGRADREREERARRTAEAMPRRLGLDTVLTIPSMRVVLVTFDNDTRRLMVRLEP